MYGQTKHATWRESCGRDRVRPIFLGGLNSKETEIKIIIFSFSRCKWEVLSMKREQEFGWTGKRASIVQLQDMKIYLNSWPAMRIGTLDTVWHTFIQLTNKNRGHKETHTHTLMEVQGFLTFWVGAWACQLLECDSSTHSHTRTPTHTCVHTHSHTCTHTYIYSYMHTDTNHIPFHLTSN